MGVCLIKIWIQGKAIERQLVVDLSDLREAEK